MHHVFSAMLPEQLFAPALPAGYDAPVSETWIEQFERLLVNHRDEIAGVVVEPVVQGAGGMRFHAPGYLGCLRDLCSAYNVLLIVDRSFWIRSDRSAVRLQAAGVVPAFLCLGKAMTEWVRLHGSNLCTSSVADVICRGEGGAFMHGPTFMGNPLAALCRA